MLLAIDIGNTQVALGVWNGEEWLHEWRLRTIHDRTSDEYGILVMNLLDGAALAADIDAVILTSVVPPLTMTFRQLSQDYLDIDPVIVDSELDTGIVIKTDNPKEVGADRIVNAVAAYYEYGEPAIVIDVGTATTFDVVSGRGELLGVAIAPGLGVAADALSQRAAQLRQVPLEAPEQAIGRNTVEAMQSGLIFGYVALIEGMVERLMAEHPDRDQKVLVIGTGGLIRLLAPYTTVIDHLDPTLTLSGLRIIYDRLYR
ncbi:MAG: type III pantothenate kinase [Candidatus Promineifilaceae bacterium]|jgi:type III pantothenate kinase